MRGYKRELDPNSAQIKALLDHAGAARWAYSWGLERKQQARVTGPRSRPRPSTCTINPAVSKSCPPSKVACPGCMKCQSAARRADRFHPSSKICSICGHVLDELPLEIRRWTCPDCGSEHHRNLTASSVLEAYRPGSAG